MGGVEVAYAVVIEGGLSSGERRRLQVCATLISKPEVVILDEPTTGLDATNALHLVRVLKRLCRDTSMTAIASLHQCRREIMTELDGALLLCKGRMVYSGPMDEVRPGVEWAPSRRWRVKLGKSFPWRVRFHAGRTLLNADGEPPGGLG